jgi:hypothetical protein
VFDVNKNRSVDIERAKEDIAITSRRIALLHLAYAETLVRELGEKKGEEVISKAIKEYGRKIGEKTREEVEKMGLTNRPENFDKGRYYGLPEFGMHDKVEEFEKDGEKREAAYGCVLAKTWKELGLDHLGRMYCYVDIAKYMSYNPNYKLQHLKAIPDGDNFCEFALRKTTKKEREDFASEENNWFYIDK